jgi:hypothetical protein
MPMSNKNLLLQFVAGVVIRDWSGQVVDAAVFPHREVSSPLQEEIMASICAQMVQDLGIHNIVEGDYSTFGVLLLFNSGVWRSCTTSKHYFCYSRLLCSCSFDFSNCCFSLWSMYLGSYSPYKYTP